MSDIHERRGGGRVPVELEVKYGSLDAFLSDYAVNLSRGGTFLHSARPAAVGTPVTLRFLLPEEIVPVEVSGEVVWRNPEGVGQLIPGMGIKFADIDKEAEKRLARFVKGCQMRNSGELSDAVKR